jgi:hypothetical protein
MNKIIPIAIDDIITDAGACSEMLTHACIRGNHWRITGGGCDGNAFLALAEEAASDAPLLNYRFAPLSPPGLDEITAAITARYTAGFSTIAFFPAADAVWGLFATAGQPEA